MTDSPATYARRVAALAGALAILELHPDGLPLRELAAELGEDPESLRQALLAYYRADVVDLPDFRLPVIEFVGPDGDAAPDGDEADESDDPATAEVVRVSSADPERELGVEYLSAEQLSTLHVAGRDLLALEPDNEELRSALQAFEDGIERAAEDAPERVGDELAARLNAAAQGRRQVRIAYVRTWAPGSASRVVEPLRVIRTRRGWELDAGPVDDQGRIRTYLVSGIRSLEVLESSFQRPAEVDTLIDANRIRTWVQLVVPQSGRWAVDRFAEEVEVLDDDEESVSLRAAFLPPVDQRVGLILITAGPDAFVMEPAVLVDAGRELARRLLVSFDGSGGSAGGATS
jgi:predicted DNA-binding transcriptional regulator YafY